MLNTKENKLKFFAQYHGQEVCKVFGYNRPIVTVHLSYIYHLELTDLRNITDEDAVEVCKIRWKNLSESNPLSRGFAGEGKRIVASIEHSSAPTSILMEIIDFLRSRGYLIGFHDATPEELISMGWVKLKEK